MLLGATALRTMAAFGLVSTLAGQAFAQTAPAQTVDTTAPAAQETQAAAGPAEAVIPQTQNAPTTNNQQIVVTGSRIRRPNLESVVPITSLSGEQFFQRGQTNIGDTLNDLPQLRSTFAQQNPGLGIGIAGLNLLDLRGLGTARTLVLVNGRRHVAADILNNAVSPDVNTIPNDLIERVDIVTGGNSAVYGSDAIAGVVNFVLQAANFDGLQLRAQAARCGRATSAPTIMSPPCTARISPTAAATSPCTANMPIRTASIASDIPWLAPNNGFRRLDVDTGRSCRTAATASRIASSSVTSAAPASITSA